MKKLFKVLGLLTIAAALFVGCNEPKDPTANPSTPPSTGPAASTSFDDCTTTIAAATDITLSAGTWTVKQVMTTKGASQTYTIKASVNNLGEYTFTSGTLTFPPLDATKAPPAFQELTTEEEKKAFIIEFYQLTENATFVFNGTIITVTDTLSDDELASKNAELKFAELPGDTVNKTNSTKSKYVISYTTTEENKGVTISTSNIIYLSKD